MWRRATGTPMLAATSRWDSVTFKRSFDSLRSLRTSIFNTARRTDAATAHRPLAGAYACHLPVRRRAGSGSVRPSAQGVVERRLGSDPGAAHARPGADAVGREGDHRRDQSRTERGAADQ